VTRQNCPSAQHWVPRRIVRIPTLDVALARDSSDTIEMTGRDIDSIKQYMPVCKGDVKTVSVSGVPTTKVVFPLEEKEFVITALHTFTDKMGYKLNCNIEV
jgi:hypothetical protein